jgi:Beta-propeller repeat
MRIRLTIAGTSVTKQSWDDGDSMRFFPLTNRRCGTMLGVLFWLMVTSFPSSAQNLEWAKRAGGGAIGSDDQGRSIAVDGSGNSYVTGDFAGSATFGAGELNQTILVSAASSDIFVAKYDSNGFLVWAKRAGGTSGSDQGRRIALDDSGNSYVTGFFQGSATFGAGELNQTILALVRLVSVAKRQKISRLGYRRAPGR